jgi:hypothetical protein
MLTFELHNTRQGSREDEEKVRAMRARVIQDMERVEYAHES